MNVDIKGRQGTGKTLTMIALMKWLCLYRGYAPSECIGNITIDAPGYTKLNNHSMRGYLKSMLTRGIRHKVILIDEIDRVFPGRFFSSPEQIETLVGLWQDEKLFSWIIYTEHSAEAGIDKILRDSAQIIVVPGLDKKRDVLDIKGINMIKLCRFKFSARPASKLYDDYDRWELVL